ncbi:MAG: hypothetical protein AB1421_09635 [Pseudomonadota bacterium]
MFAPFLRKIILAHLSRQPYDKGLERSRQAALAQFRRASKLPGYHSLLREAGIDPQEIRSWTDFPRLPLLGKDNTFLRFPLESLCMPGTLDHLAGVLTSSGQSGKFAFGLTTRRQSRKSTFLIDLALEATFQVDRYKTLLINALPMGVGFASNAVTVAETSVREDMVLALADKFGPHFEQIILVTDPLFLKLLCDTSRDRGFDWHRFRVHAIIGEETIGEHYRSYVGNILGTDPDNPDGPILGASMGAGELGLNLFFETPQTIALRRTLHKDAALRRHFLGEDLEPEQIPMLFTYSTTQILVECLPQAGLPDGFGQLTLTPLATDAPLPLLRYQTGDLARVSSPDILNTRLAQAEHPLLRRWHMPVVALRGRDSEECGALNVSQIKDCLYRDTGLADTLTGAFRWEPGSPGALHVQLRPGMQTTDIDSRIRAVLPVAAQTLQVVPWPHEHFPFGMKLDYERKFKYL